MTIKLICPGCDAKINAPDVAAGKRAKCPGCGAAVDVPSGVSAKPFPSRRVKNDDNAGPAAPSRLNFILVVGLSVFCFAVLVVGAMLVWQVVRKPAAEVAKEKAKTPDLIVKADGPKIAQKQVDPRVDAFRSRMLAFTDESMGLVRLIEEYPETQLYAKKMLTVSDLFVRIPEPPDERCALLHKTAREVRVEFLFLQEQAKFIPEFDFYGKKEEGDRILAQCRQRAQVQRGKIVQLERSLAND